MPTSSVAPLPAREVRNIDLAMMSLREAPDLWTAIEAGIMHGLPPREALRAAFHKWLGDNQEAVQTFGLANFYRPGDTSKAFINHKAFAEYAVICIAEQERAIKALAAEVHAIRTLLPSLPSTETSHGNV